jgi:hypothetical protein
MKQRSSCKQQASLSKESWFESIHGMSEKKQIPIVCPGHTRPLAEVQFCQTGTNMREIYAADCQRPSLTLIVV